MTTGSVIIKNVTIIYSDIGLTTSEFRIFT